MPSSTAPAKSPPPPPYSSGAPTQPFPALPSDTKTTSRRPQPTHSRSHSNPLPNTQQRPRRSRPRHNSTYLPPDVIDLLDDITPFHYHHEGPYDAASHFRNRSSSRSSSRRSSNPIDALKSSNEEALKATPPGKIADCIWNARPLDGVAFYPPGSTDPAGNTYDYEEGWNMMTEDRGNFKRWPGMKFRDEDFKNDPAYMGLVNAPSWTFPGLRRRRR
ncbi:hypothetical protein GX51_04097 [Blastomyces parvus]|uniref:Uncharacterized protein n=1 Tax=Blastomyces parvus TaxID=2060905 RepID=A0A2B7X2U5_9EURO|nr:hypothetical protein GX51_04097 [Blastomyces parvus]